MTHESHDDLRVIAWRGDVEQLADLLTRLLRLGPYSLKDLETALQVLRDRLRD